MGWSLFQNCSAVMGPATRSMESPTKKRPCILSPHSFMRMTASDAWSRREETRRRRVK